MKKAILIFTLFATLALSSSQVFAEHIFYTFGNGGPAQQNDDQLRVVDPETGNVVSQVTITLASETVRNGHGLAVDPTTGKLWALLSIAEQPGRELVIIDPVTGVATSIGNTGDKFSAIAFDSSGTLFGVTGDGATLATTLFIVSTSDASLTQVCAIGIPFEFQGEALAFNFGDGFLYHGEGGRGGAPIKFERVDSFPADSNDRCNTTDIPLSGVSEHLEVRSVTYNKSQDLFYWVEQATGNLLTLLFKITPTGIQTEIGLMDHNTKGIAFSIEEIIDPAPDLITVDFSGKFAGKFAGKFNDDSFISKGKYIIDGKKFKHVTSSGNYNVIEQEGSCNLVIINNGIWDFGNENTLIFEAEGENCSKKFFKRLSGTFSVIGGTGIFDNAEGEGEINLINGRRHLVGKLSGTLGIPEE